ncbi:MAG: heparinase II/III family protein [Myxococcaceae bacterium]|nr:heparinase II/III family protein [Myxococcaceae bacterium]
MLSTRQLDVSITISPASAAMAPGTTRDFTARVTGAQSDDVGWASSAGSIAGTGTTITFTAPATAGQVTVTATSVAEPEKSATATVTVSESVTNGLAIPPGHPRIGFDAQRLAAARERFTAQPFTPRRDAWDEVALRALLSRDPQSCRTAIDRALGHDVSSFSSDIANWEAEAAILAYDWCFDAWSAAERADFIARWNSFLLEETMQAWGNTDMPQSDVFWHYLRNELLFGVATFHENPMADGFLRHALDVRFTGAFVPSAANGGRGGVLQPGSNRGCFVTSAATLPFVTAQLHGRDLWAETAFFRDAVWYLAYATTPALTRLDGSSSRFFEVFPSNEDGEWEFGNSAGRSEYGDFMTAAERRYPASATGRIARSWLDLTGAPRSQAARSTESPIVAAPFTGLPLDAFFAGTQWLYGRSAWGGAATVFQAQLGVLSGNGFEHEDLGNWQLWRNGVWLSRESAAYYVMYVGQGGMGSQFARHAIGHNVLLVNGRGLAHEEGRGAPVVRRLESNPQWVYADADLTGGYRVTDMYNPQRDNPAAQHVERELLFLRGLETLVILDRVQTTAPSTFLAHFETAPVLEDATHVSAVNADQAVRLTTLLPAGATYRVVNEGSLGQHRLEVDTAATGLVYFLHVVQARDASGANHATALSESATQLTVTVGGTTVVFEKGLTSSGGTVNGVPLRADVQPVQLGDNGPVWGL